MRPTSLSRGDQLARSAGRRATTGLACGALAIAAVSLLIAALDQVTDPTALTGLYLFAILPVAIAWGFRLAGVVALASFVTFSYFFLPPRHSFAIAQGEAAAALVITLVTAYVVSELARRAYARAEEARAKTREAEEAQAGGSLASTRRCGVLRPWLRRGCPPPRSSSP